jgi:hypothetical protein
MQVNANGQVQRSAAQWGAIIEQYRQSGMGIKEFCTQEGLTVRTFEKWYRRTRSAEQRKGQFIEVKPLATAGRSWEMEMEFPTGVRVRVRG